MGWLAYWLFFDSLSTTAVDESRMAGRVISDNPFSVRDNLSRTVN